jgi:hypothetical protein
VRFLAAKQSGTAQDLRLCKNVGMAFLQRFFMHTGAQMKYVSRADGCPAHEQGENFPCSIAKGCVRKIAAAVI